MLYSPRVMDTYMDTWPGGVNLGGAIERANTELLAITSSTPPPRQHEPTQQSANQQ